MKRMLLLLISLLLVSNAAIAGIAIYSDATGSSCNLGAPGFSSTATVIHIFSAGSTGSRFKVTLPAGSTFFSFSTAFPTIGTLTSDLSIAYGQCLVGHIVLGNITATLTSGKLDVRPPDAHSNITYTDCSFVELPTTGHGAYVGMSGQCDITIIPTQPSSWGGVKALYR